MAAHASVEVLDGPVPRVVTVPRTGISIGRAPDNDLVITLGSVSGHHAELRWQGDDLIVNDRGSSYGTRRDGQRIDKPTMVRDGDELVLAGAVVLRVSIHGARFGSSAAELLPGDAGLVAEQYTHDVEPLALDMLRIVESLFQATSYEELGARVVEAVAQHFKPSRVALLEIEDDGERFRVLGLHNASRVDPRPLRDATFVSRTVVETARQRGIAHYREGGGQTASRSLMISGAHSAVAASMRARHGRDRLLYMDATIGEAPLTASHAIAFELFTAHAAAAFEALHSQLAVAKDQLRFQQLRRYFSPAVVEHLLSGDGSLVDRPHIVDATVLFADMVGYTALSERLRGEPERLLDLLNRWLDAGARAAIAHRGTLDKFIGDCVMVVFGAPFSFDHEELAAVRCAQQMMRAIADISQKVGTELYITVGINSGEMLAGSVGSKRRLEYTVLGDTVNVAARLQGSAKPGEILVGPETRRRLEGQVAFADAGAFDLKNRGMVQAYRVVESPA